MQTVIECHLLGEGRSPWTKYVDVKIIGKRYPTIIRVEVNDKNLIIPSGVNKNSKNKKAYIIPHWFEKTGKIVKVTIPVVGNFSSKEAINLRMPKSSRLIKELKK